MLRDSNMSSTTKSRKATTERPVKKSTSPALRGSINGRFRACSALKNNSSRKRPAARAATTSLRCFGSGAIPLPAGSFQYSRVSIAGREADVSSGEWLDMERFEVEGTSIYVDFGELFSGIE